MRWRPPACGAHLGVEAGGALLAGHCDEERQQAGLAPFLSAGCRGAPPPPTPTGCWPTSCWPRTQRGGRGCGGLAGTWLQLLASPPGAPPASMPTAPCPLPARRRCTKAPSPAAACRAWRPAPSSCLLSRPGGRARRRCSCRRSHAVPATSASLTPKAAPSPTLAPQPTALTTAASCGASPSWLQRPQAAASRRRQPAPGASAAGQEWSGGEAAEQEGRGCSSGSGSFVVVVERVRERALRSRDERRGTGQDTARGDGGTRLPGWAPRSALKM